MSRLLGKALAGLGKGLTEVADDRLKEQYQINRERRLAAARKEEERRANAEDDRRYKRARRDKKADAAAEHKYRMEEIKASRSNQAKLQTGADGRVYRIDASGRAIPVMVDMTEAEKAAARAQAQRDVYNQVMKSGAGLLALSPEQIDVQNYPMQKPFAVATKPNIELRNVNTFDEKYGIPNGQTIVAIDKNTGEARPVYSSSGSAAGQASATPAPIGRAPAGVRDGRYTSNGQTVVVRGGMIYPQ